MQNLESDVPGTHLGTSFSYVLCLLAAQWCFIMMEDSAHVTRENAFGVEKKAGANPGNQTGSAMRPKAAKIFPLAIKVKLLL